MDQPMFIGVNLPPKLGSNGQQVAAALESGYDMVTSRITSRAYKKKVQAIIHEMQRSSTYEQYNGNGNGIVAEEQRSGLSRLQFSSVEDTLIKPGSHISNTIGVSSPWIELDSKDSVLYEISCKVLDYEAGYASFCGLKHLIVTGPKRRNNAVMYGQALNVILNKYPSLELSIHLPFCEEFSAHAGSSNRSSANSQPNSSNNHNNGASNLTSPPAPEEYLSIWEVWNTIRHCCDYASNLKIALQLPNEIVLTHVVSRWFAEPVSMLIVTLGAFVANVKDYPVLPKWSQAIFHQFIKRRPFVITDSLSYGQHYSQTRSNHSNGHQLDSPGHNQNRSANQDRLKFCGGDHAPMIYLRHLFQTQPDPTAIQAFAAGYEDRLQTPLQPLVDNLDSRTYEVFEKDPVKYNQYERAIVSALEELARNKGMNGNKFEPIQESSEEYGKRYEGNDRENEIVADSSSGVGKANTSPGLANNKAIVVAVLGAGRGPLIIRALRAAKRVGCQIKVLAVEKNPWAYSYLISRQAEWGTQVKIVQADMRVWEPDCNIDIVVSELLGSFGDNELAPECLHGVLTRLRGYRENSEVGRRIRGPIVIPDSHASFITPLFSPILFSSARHNCLQTPYVVMMDHVEYVAEPKMAWMFSYKEDRSKADDAKVGAPFAPAEDHSLFERRAKLTFDIAHRTMIHGLGGFFDSKLAPDVILSTCPGASSPESPDNTSLVSWFPLYLPLISPIYVTDDSQIDVYLWRRSDGRKIWYEWAVDAFTISDGVRVRTCSSVIHNSMGKKYAMIL